MTDPIDFPLCKPRLLLVEKCKSWLAMYLNCIYQKTIFSIITDGAKIDYCKPKQKIISTNLLLATHNLDTLITDLKNQIVAN